MRSAVLLFIILMIITGMVGYCCFTYVSRNKKSDNVPIDDGMYATCPVTSSPIEKGKAVEITYNGKKYVLCCIACKSVFEKDPQKFIDEHKRSEFGLDMQAYPKMLYRPK